MINCQVVTWETNTKQGLRPLGGPVICYHTSRFAGCVKSMGTDISISNKRKIKLVLTPVFMI